MWRATRQLRESYGMGRIETRQLAEQVYELLLHNILGGKLRPGERVLDQELAAELGISRTPVKDAINRLAIEELLEIHPRRGTFVVEPDLASFAELMDVRLMIELHACRHASPDASARAISGMSRAIATLNELLAMDNFSDIAAFMSADGDFHRSLVAGVGNGRLSQLYEPIAIHNQIARIKYPPDSFLLAQNEHRQILDAYQRGADSDLSALLTKHIERARKQVLGPIDCCLDT